MEKEQASNPPMTRELYYYKHIACPNCGSIHTHSTYMGYIFDRDNPESFKDENLATCKCGWRGKVHDLVEMK